MNQREKTVILSFCKNNMNRRKTSEEVYYCRSYTNKILKKIYDETGLNPRLYNDLKILEAIARKGKEMDRSKDFEEYVKRYADKHCNGDVEEAKKHAIVRSVQKYYEEK